MVLFSFSVPWMIPKIKDGSKHQTTRVPRKPRIVGPSFMKREVPAYKVGDRVQLYYRSRQRRGCDNCIIAGCIFRETHEYVGKIYSCGDYSNFFGESTITEILHYWNAPYKENGDETWMGHTIGHMDDEDRESWAKADGFEGWDQACDFFTRNESVNLTTRYYEYWANQKLDVIVWEKEQIIKNWQSKNVSDAVEKQGVRE